MTFVAASGEVAHNINFSFKTWLIYWYLLLHDMNFDKLDFVIVDAEIFFCCLFWPYQQFLVSGASDGLLILWSADHINDSRELVPKLSLKVIFPPHLFSMELRNFEERMRKTKIQIHAFDE